MTAEGHKPELEHLQWDRRPELRTPVIIAAFAGWSDAGDAATTAARFLVDHWEAERFAAVDPEVFYDFTSTRPRVEFDDAGERQVTWPENEFFAASIPGTAADAVIVIGNEPQLRWRTFCEQITGVAQTTGVGAALTFGALLAEVPHARPVSVFGVGHDERMTRDLGLLVSRYEGPTGITGVLQTAFRDLDIPSASMWAAVPTYVPSAPSPKAALALVERAGRFLDVTIDTSVLRDASKAYEEEVSELVEEDDETSDYVRQIEERYDEEEPQLFIDDAPRLVEEVERFLRDQD